MEFIYRSESIRASDVGAPHHRDRWFGLCTMGNTEHDGQPTESQLRGNETSSYERRAQEPQQAGQLTRTDRPADVPSIRRGADGGEPAEVLADTASTGLSERGQAGQPTVNTQKRTGMVGESERCGDVANTNNERCEKLNTPGISEIPGRHGGCIDAGRGAGWWATESGVCRVAHEFSNRFHGCDSVQEGEINERQICTETGPAKDSVVRVVVPEVFVNGKSAPASPRLQQAVGCGNNLRELPRGATRSGEVGGSHKDESLPVLCREFSIQEGTGNNVQPVVREQVGLDASWWQFEPAVGRVANGVEHRVHRLKGLGNAQVPLQAAIAYRMLGGLK